MELRLKAKMTFANHHERQFMQYLRGAGWIKARTLSFAFNSTQ